MARRARAAARPEKPSDPSHIKRHIPFFELVDEAGLQKLEAQADWLIENIGLEFRDDPLSLEHWKAAGARVEDTRVRADAGLIRELLKTAPSEFQQVARNPALTVTIGGANQVFAPIYGAPFCRDLEGGRRYGTMDDLERLVKITQSLDSLHHTE